jgi:hypothetical protein
MSRKYSDLTPEEKELRKEKARAWRTANPDKVRKATYNWRYDSSRRRVVNVVLDRRIVDWFKAHAASRGKSFTEVLGTAMAYYKDYYDKHSPNVE